jgi:hypothetical protein
MPISWQIGFIILNVDPGIVEPRGELAWEGVMHFKLAHPLLPQHVPDFFVKAVDIPLGRNPGWTAKRLKLWVLGIQVFAGSCARCCEAAAEYSPVETALARLALLRCDAANFVHSARPELTLADRRRIGPRQELGSEQKFGSEQNPPRAEARTGRLALVRAGLAGSTDPTSPHSVGGASVIH